MTERFQQKNISVPDGIWIMRQTWNDVLFAHWPVDVSILRALVPSVLELDTYNGQASFLHLLSKKRLSRYGQACSFSSLLSLIDIACPPIQNTLKYRQIV